MEVEKAEQTNGSLKHDLDEKDDSKTLKKPSVSRNATPQPVEKADSQLNGASPSEKTESEKPAEPETAATTRAPGPASAPGPSVNPQPVTTEEASNSTAAPKFSSNVLDNEKKEDNEKHNDNDDEEEEKTNEPVEPPLRKVEEDENYDDE